MHESTPHPSGQPHQPRPPRGTREIDRSSVLLAPQIQLDCAAASWRGAERERNEDQYAVATVDAELRVLHSGTLTARPLPAQLQPTAMLLAVADGMGGGRRGDLASAEAVAALLEQLELALHRGAPLDLLDQDRVPGAREDLRRAFAAGQQRIERVADRPVAAGRRTSATPMGTTLTVAYLVWPIMYVAHAGDSRCYLLRSGAVTQLTKDHTVAQKMMDEGVGGLSEQSRLHDVLYNALGAGDGTHEPDVRRVQLAPNDVIILASDGVTNVVDMQLLGERLGLDADVQTAVHWLGQTIRTAQGSDDATALLGWVRAAPGAAS